MANFYSRGDFHHNTSLEWVFQVPSTALAYHWTQSCIGAEATEWKRALCAIDWWEKASYEAVEKAAKVEALRLFQKAADIADKISSEATQDISTLSMVGLLSSETESTASKVKSLYCPCQ